MKLIFITPYSNNIVFEKIAGFFYGFRVLNAIIVSMDKKISIYSLDEFKSTEDVVLNQITSKKLRNWFPNKLESINGYTYRTIFAANFPRIFPKDGKLKGMDVKLMQTIIQHQNATIVYYHSTREYMQYYWKNFIKLKIDLCMNAHSVIVKTNFSFDYVNLYETDGFCALMPHPKRKSLLENVVLPFDSWTWLLMIVSLIFMIIFWRYLSKTSNVPNPNSWSYFLFAYFAFFIGQGVDFRNHRTLQKVLIQLMIFMAFILGNIYQTKLVSLLAEPRYEDKIATARQLMNQKYLFYVDPIFEHMLNFSEHFESFRKITLVSDFKELNYSHLAQENVGIIMPCTVADRYLLDKEYLSEFNISNVADYYYKVPEKLYTYYMRFIARTYSQFADRIQEYILRIFEAGLRQRWKSELNFEKVDLIKNEEIFFFTLKDMAGAFLYLGVGHAISFIVFLLELIVFHIKKYVQMRKERRNPNVHFIQVQPRV